MADYLVKAGGTPSSPYNTWASASADCATIDAVDVAGDNVYISYQHTETQVIAATKNFNWAGTGVSPTRIISVDDAAQPPTTKRAGAVVATTGAFSTFWNCGAAAYTYGITFEWGSGSSTNISSGCGANTSGGKAVFEACNFKMLNTGAGSRIYALPSTAGVQSVWRDCWVQFSNNGQALSTPNAGKFVWEGGGLLAASTAPATLIKASGGNNGGRPMKISGLDLSLITGGSAMNLVEAAQTGLVSEWRNIKLPASWTGSFVTGTFNPSDRHSFYNVTDGTTNYRLYVGDYSGTIVDETGYYRTGGATDGSTPISYKMVTSANADETLPLTSEPINKWNTNTASQTITVEILHDSATALTDADVYMVVEYQDTTGPKSIYATERPMALAGSAQASSAAAWNNSGLMTNPNKQKLEVTITAARAGYITVWVYLTKASYTLYIDPIF